MALADKIPWLDEASKRNRWLVGVSGGADSVALLHLLAWHGFSKLVVCHLDHRLRGRASTADARFVEKLAAKLGFVSETGRADVKRRMKETSESMETAARHARHAFFEECAAKHRCPRLLLAHHADDQAETILWNLFRGSHGLKGMRARQSIGKLDIIRPLLGIRRAEILEWITANGIPWREDGTNREPVAARNRIRNEAIPLLAEISGRDIVPSLLRATADALDAEIIGDWALERAGVIDPQGRLHLPAIRLLPVALQRRAIHRFLSDSGVHGIDHALIDRAIALLEPSAAPAINLPGGTQLRRRAGRISVLAYEKMTKLSP